VTALKPSHSLLRIVLLTVLLGAFQVGAQGQVDVSPSVLVRVGITPLTGGEGSMGTQVLSADRASILPAARSPMQA